MNILKLNFMKRINLFLLGLVAMGMTFTSCTDDTEAVGPSVTFKAGTGLITGDATISSGDVASFSWEALKGDANLVEFTIRIDNQDVDGFPNMDINKDEYQDTWDTTLVTPGDYTFSFIVEDKDGLTAKQDVTVTVESDLTSQGEKQLGAGSSSLPSYYSVADATEMNLSAAIASPNKVDFVFKSTASEASFSSPKDAANVTISDANRTTLYKKVDFAFASAVSADVDAVTPTADNITVVKGDVIVFVTEDDDKGVFEVTNLAVATDGTVTIDIMVK